MNYFDIGHNDGLLWWHDGRQIVTASVCTPEGDCREHKHLIDRAAVALYGRVDHAWRVVSIVKWAEAGPVLTRAVEAELNARWPGYAVARC